MNHVAAMNVFEQDSSFLRFGAWSVVVHALFFVFVSFVHFSLDVEEPPPTVKVTFVETPAPPPPEPEPQAPPMLQAQRLQPQPVQRKQIQPPPQPPPVSQPVEIPEVVAQPPPQQPPPQPMERRILTDSRATDTLKARNLTKVASRRTPSPTTTTKVEEPPSLFVPGFSTVAALEGAATRHVVRASLPATAPGSSRRTLQASRGAAQTMTSVGILRHHLPYPPIAQKSGWEGTVLVRVTVETNGKASKVALSRSSGHKILDDAAIKAVKRWSFRPARDGNIPVRSVAIIPVKFSLKEKKS